MKELFALVGYLFFATAVMAQTVWIDVRTEAEYNAEHIDGAVRISYQEIGSKIESLFPNKEQEIMLYCRSGRRSGIALGILKDMGYVNAKNAGGLNEAKKVYSAQKK